MSTAWFAFGGVLRPILRPDPKGLSEHAGDIREHDADRRGIPLSDIKLATVPLSSACMSQSTFNDEPTLIDDGRTRQLIAEAAYIARVRASRRLRVKACSADDQHQRDQVPCVACVLLGPLCTAPHIVPVPVHRGYEVSPRVIDLAVSIYVDTGIHGKRLAFNLSRCIKTMERSPEEGCIYRYTIFATDSVSFAPSIRGRTYH